jgi:putative FmdB family regulatory protein
VPLYEYACNSCQTTIERRQHFNDEPLHQCPKCGSAVRRLLQPAGVIFKGSGWYCTDHRAKQNTTEN